MNAEIFIITLITFVFLFGLFKGVDVFSSFVKGAKEGIHTCFSILPLLICIITVITIFKQSGSLNLFVNILSPIFSFFGIPKEAIPLALMRPISGSGSLAIFSDIIKTNGADSYVGLVSAVMTSSVETTLYTITVYLGAFQLKKSGVVLTSALLADFFAAIFSCFIVKLLFKF